MVVDIKDLSSKLMISEVNMAENTEISAAGIAEITGDLSSKR